MTHVSQIDYSAFDRPEILRFLFHPRSEESISPPPENAKDFNIPVQDGLFIGARLHGSDKAAPVILFFHGNGEIVSDYNDFGPMYSNIGINFLPVDYRGYGRSTGTPTVTGMMRDCHAVFDYFRKWLNAHEYTGSLIVMGRSLGSASALELAESYQNEIDGLIIESGFAYFAPLLQLLGVNIHAMGIREKEGLLHIEKVQNFYKPARFIHAEYDHIIPFSDAQALFDACPAPDKKLLKIPEADHNTLFYYGMDEYMNLVRDLLQTLIHNK
jgi:alpha-beta hydrolase superfamily lysophospholipase